MQVNADDKTDDECIMWMLVTTDEQQDVNQMYFEEKKTQLKTTK